MTEPPQKPEPRRPGRLARSTAFFSIATAFSRVAGVIREIVAANYFGVNGPMSAFTIAFAVPNTVRSLFADAAIQGSFLPVFTELLEKGQRREAFRLASTLLYLITLILALVSAVFVLVAPVLMPVFVNYTGHQLDLVIALSRILFPIVVLLGITGIVVGVLNSFDRFAAFAISPLFWNLAIIAVLVGFIPAFPSGDGIYVYAVAIIIGTIVQLAIPALDLRKTPFRPLRVFDWRNPLVRRVLLLMLPVSISLGLINFNLLINSFVGTLIHNPEVALRAPAAIDKAFRIYMLPQGIFSVAVATVLFPTLARLAARADFDSLRATMANGMRQIVLLLTPAMAAILVLSEPMIRLVYQRGEFTASQTSLVSTALFWFAFSLPLNGLFLLLTRTFFGLQRPWIPSAIAAVNLALTAGFALALYGHFEIAGIVAATLIATAASVIAQVVILRRMLGGLELTRLAHTTARVVLAAAGLAVVSYLVWKGLDDALGRQLWAQLISMGAALATGAAVYAGAVTAMRVPEAHQIRSLLRRSG